MPAALLQQPEVPTQNYDFKSEGIITTLEELMTKFKSTLNDLDAEETKSIAEYDSAMQELTTTKADQEGDLAKTQKSGKLANHCPRNLFFIQNCTEFRREQLWFLPPNLTFQYF